MTVVNDSAFVKATLGKEKILADARQFRKDYGMNMGMVTVFQKDIETLEKDLIKLECFDGHAIATFIDGLKDELDDIGYSEVMA